MKHVSKLVLALLFCLGAAISFAQSAWDNVERIVALGDIHGDFDQYIEVLERNGLIDDRQRWAGGTTHFVQLGDVPDRGPDTHKVIEHLQQLERQAKRAGGHVHALIGNHEAMNITGDLRYVHPGEYEALTTRRSSRLQAQYIKNVQAWMEENFPDEDRSIEALEARYPEGYVEHRRAWAADGDFGRWVLDHNSVIRINDTLFVHGGLSPHVEPTSLDAINDAIREVLTQGESMTGENITNAEDSPLWYRGLATNEAEKELAPLIDMLNHYGARRIVVAHTPTGGEIKTRLDGRVVLADVGLAAYYGGHDANLLIEGGELFEVNPDGKRPLQIELQVD